MTTVASITRVVTDIESIRQQMAIAQDAVKNADQELARICLHDACQTIQSTWVELGRYSPQAFAAATSHLRRK